MIKRREREGKRKKGRRKDIEREGEIREREREGGRGERKRGRERDREVKGMEGKWGEKRAAHGHSLRVNPRKNLLNRKIMRKERLKRKILGNE